MTAGRREAASPVADRDSDEWWVERIPTGHGAQALRVLYERHGRPAFSLARRVCRDEGLAQEAVQDAFLELWREAVRFDPVRGTVAGWLMMLVHRRSVDAVRKEQRVRQRAVALELLDRDHGLDWAPAADHEVIRSEDARQVRTALRSLPPGQRRVLELCFYEGFTHAEVAQHLGLPLGTVKSRLYGGVQRLRESLG